MKKIIEVQTPTQEVLETVSEKTVMTYSQTMGNLVYFMFGILETALAFRFLFKIMGANPRSGFVSWIYDLTTMFVYPFEGIFRKSTTSGAETTAIFEPSTLMAIIVYGVIAAGIVKLIFILSREPEGEAI